MLTKAFKDSHHLKQATYNPATSTLVIEFKNGATYAYQKVPRVMYDNLIGYRSSGEYFHTVIRPLRGVLIKPAKKVDTK